MHAWTRPLDESFGTRAQAPKAPRSPPRQPGPARVLRSPQTPDSRAKFRARGTWKPTRVAPEAVVESMVRSRLSAMRAQNEELKHVNACLLARLSAPPSRQQSSRRSTATAPSSKRHVAPSSRRQHRARHAAPPVVRKGAIARGGISREDLKGSIRALKQNERALVAQQRLAALRQRVAAVQPPKETTASRLRRRAIRERAAANEAAKRDADPHGRWRPDPPSQHRANEPWYQSSVRTARYYGEDIPPSIVIRDSHSGPLPPPSPTKASLARQAAHDLKQQWLRQHDAADHIMEVLGIPGVSAAFETRRVAGSTPPSVPERRKHFYP